MARHLSHLMPKRTLVTFLPPEKGVHTSLVPAMPVTLCGTISENFLPTIYIVAPRHGMFSMGQLEVIDDPLRAPRSAAAATGDRLGFT